MLLHKSQQPLDLFVALLPQQGVVGDVVKGIPGVNGIVTLGKVCQALQHGLHFPVRPGLAFYPWLCLREAHELHHLQLIGGMHPTLVCLPSCTPTSPGLKCGSKGLLVLMCAPVGSLLLVLVCAGPQSCLHALLLHSLIEPHHLPCQQDEEHEIRPHPSKDWDGAAQPGVPLLIAAGPLGELRANCIPP